MRPSFEATNYSQAHSEYPPQRCSARTKEPSIHRRTLSTHRIDVSTQSSKLPTSVPLVFSAVMQCMLEAEESSPERAGEAIYENSQDATAPACVKLRSGPIVSAKVEREAQLRVDGPHAALEKGIMNSREGNASNVT